MVENRYLPYDDIKEEGHPLHNRPVGSLNLPTTKVFVVSKSTIGELVDYFNNPQNPKVVPVVANEGDVKLISAVYQNKLMKFIVNRKLKRVGFIYNNNLE